MNLKKIIIATFGMLLSGLVYVGRVLAVPTPSTTPQGSPIDETLTTIRQEVQKGSLETISLPKNIGVVGTVSAISSVGDLVKIATVRQGEKSASISGQTAIFRLDANGIRRQVKADNIKVGDKAIAIGQTTDSGTVTAKRITLFVPDDVTRLVFMGRVLSISANKVSVVPMRGKEARDFSISSETNINQFIAGPAGSEGGKLTSLKISNINKDDLVIVAGRQTGNKTPEASLVVRLPSTSPLPSPSLKAK